MRQRKLGTKRQRIRHWHQVKKVLIETKRLRIREITEIKNQRDNWDEARKKKFIYKKKIKASEIIGMKCRIRVRN